MAGTRADGLGDLFCEIISAANGKSDLSCLTPDLLSRLAQAYDLQRISLFQVHEAPGIGIASTCRADWRTPGLPAMIMGTHPPLTVTGGDEVLQDWAARRRRGEVIHGLTRNLKGYVRHFFERHGIVNFFTVPVIVQGRWWGHVCVDAADPQRAWTPDEQVTFHALAEVIAGLVSRSDAARTVSEASWQVMLDTSIDAVVVADEAGAIIEFNRAAERAFGFSRADVVGRSMSDTIVPAHYQHRHMAGFAHYLASGESQILQRLVEVEAKRADGSLFPVELAVSEIRTENGRIFAAYLRDISERRKAQLELERLAYIDPATELPNRTGLLRLCNRKAELAAGALVVQLRDLAVLAASLGDEWAEPMVVETARILRDLLPEDAVLGRTGESEFAIVLWQAGMAAEVGLRLQDRLRTAVAVAGRRFYLRGDVGVAERRAAVADLLRDAEMASRDRPEGAIRLFNESIRIDHHRRLELETALRDAVQHRQAELSLHYQPIVQLQDGRIVGFEALVRWQPPGRPAVPPSVFVPLAEASGLAHSLGEWTLETALRDCAAWSRRRREEGLGIRHVAVNLSAAQMAAPDLTDRIMARLSHWSLDGRMVRFELTESSILSQPDLAISTLSRLKSLGCSTAIDDFGTGYSSFSYLQRLPVDMVKIDRSFIEDLVTDRRTQEIVRVMIVLAHGLGMSVVAEGIETLPTHRALALMGCDFGQGFLLGRPVPADVAQALPQYRRP